jgi:hypothetical protein
MLDPDRKLFWMRDDVADKVRVINYVKVEAPVLGDPSLPEIAGLVVLFGVKRGVMKVFSEKTDLLKKCLADARRQLF